MIRKGVLCKIIEGKGRSLNSERIWPTKSSKDVKPQMLMVPSLKSAFSNDLKSRVVYKLLCSRCTSPYVGQTVQHLTTRIEEHKKADSPVGPHVQQ